jgi:uncharacterized protein HemY
MMAFHNNELLAALCVEQQARLLEEARRHELLRTCQPDAAPRPNLLYHLGDGLVSVGEWLKAQNTLDAPVRNFS